MLNFCTLFDSHYLSRGLTMYQSLKKHCRDFHLFVFAFDNQCYQFLAQLKLKNVTVISLLEFEEQDLLSIKDGRTQEEYCWTCTPATIKFCIDNYNLNSCTYVDADLFFFESPSVLISEMQNKSILITEHRFSKKYRKHIRNGKYCVQFMTFHNTKQGMKALNWWKKSCIDWCFRYPEDGKLGDQKYLDDWLLRFDGVHSLRHLGGGTGPWNTQQYSFNFQRSLFGIEKTNDKKFLVIFYHFHGLKLLDNGLLYLGGYRLSKNTLNFIYKPYVKCLLKTEKEIQESCNPPEITGFTESKKIILNWKWILKSTVKRTYNLHRIQKFTR